MISIKSDRPIRTDKIAELTSIFEPHFDTDIEISVNTFESYILMSAQNVTKRVINDGSVGAYKLCAYLLLSELTKVTLPWGSLTGVKPLKRLKELVEQGLSNEEAYAALKLKYMLSDSKAELLFKTFENQKHLLYPQDNAYGLYIHIPLCPSKCSYCSFPSLVTAEGSELCEQYLNALFYELDKVDELKPDGFYYDSVYVGGGTPSILSEAQLARLLEKIKALAPTAEEITFEAGRSDTTTPAKLRLLKQAGVNRISLNPQTVHNDTLKKVNRNLTFESFLDIYEAAEAIGISDINCDLIFGLAGETEKDFEESLKRIIGLSAANITLHSLCAKRSAVTLKTETAQVTQDVSAFLDRAAVLLAENRYAPYYLYRQKYVAGNAENTGYTKPGKECIYNIRMMGDVQTIFSAGADSATKLCFPKLNLYTGVYNVKELKLYINNIEAVTNKKLAAMRKLLLNNKL